MKMLEQDVLTLGVGVVVLLVAWLPTVLRKLPLSLPIICVAIGVLSFYAGAFDVRPSMVEGGLWPEHATELVVIVSLMGAGLRLDRPFDLRGWNTTWRLLLLAMPLSIGAMMLLAIYVGGYFAPAALLLAAMLAPTDPVLASDVQVGPPGSGEQGEIRFGLTSEAGLNDGLAFPFVVLAIGWLSGELIGPGFLAWHFGGRLLIAMVIGYALGWLFGFLTFHVPRAKLSDTGDGLVALGVTFVVYAVTQALGGYGFVAVFVAALTLRSMSRDDSFHRAMTDFSDSIERVLMMLVLVLFGNALGAGLLRPLEWQDGLLVALLLLVVRPLIGWVSLLGSPHPRLSRFLTAFFGIRGIGSFYYLAYALNQAHWTQHARLSATIALAVLCSITLHGITSTPLMQWADEVRAQLDRARQRKRERRARLAERPR